MYKRSYHIHFVGIGGIGMSGIAELLLNLGHRVSGSDVQESDITRRLETLGATVFYTHQPEQVPQVGSEGFEDVLVTVEPVAEREGFVRELLALLLCHLGLRLYGRGDDLDQLRRLDRQTGVA